MCVYLKRRQEACAWMGRAVFAPIPACARAGGMSTSLRQRCSTCRVESERVGWGSRAASRPARVACRGVLAKVGKRWAMAAACWTGVMRGRCSQEKSGSTSAVSHVAVPHSDGGSPSATMRKDGCAGMVPRPPPERTSRVPSSRSASLMKVGEARRAEREKIRRQREAEVVGRCVEGRQNGPSIHWSGGRQASVPTHLPVVHEPLQRGERVGVQAVDAIQYHQPPFPRAPEQRAILFGGGAGGKRGEGISAGPVKVNRGSPAERRTKY